MSHRGNQGWGRLPSYIITTVSCTCLWRNCNIITVLVAACPLHPWTGHSLSPPPFGKAILYVWLSLSVGGISHCHLPPTSIPCCVFRCTASNPTSISSQNSKHFTMTLCLSQYVNPYPFIRPLFTVSDWVSDVWQGHQTIPAVSHTFFCSPIILNSPVRVLNAPFSQFGSVDATSPSSA